jgi:small-conductance mechanosensitive channel
MRFAALIPLLCIVAAFLLSILCLFAGSSRGFLQNVDLLTLNTSMIGRAPVFNTSDGSDGFFSAIWNDIEGDVNDIVGDVASSLARTLNIHDFYKAFILDYCEGYYEPNGTVAKPRKNVTQCSSRGAFFHFDPTNIIESELRTDLNLSDIKWPDQIEDAAQAVDMTERVMFVLYCIGIAFAGIAVVGAFFGFIASGRMSALLNFMLCILGFAALGLASALATIVILKVCYAINRYGRPIGIAAYKGKTFLGMTWAATCLALLAAFLWIGECFGIRRRRTRVVREKQVTT